MDINQLCYMIVIIIMSIDIILEENENVIEIEKIENDYTIHPTEQ